MLKDINFKKTNGLHMFAFGLVHFSNSTTRPSFPFSHIPSVVGASPSSLTHIIATCCDTGSFVRFSDGLIKVIPGLSFRTSSWSSRLVRRISLRSLCNRCYFYLIICKNYSEIRTSVALLCPFRNFFIVQLVSSSI